MNRRWVRLAGHLALIGLVWMGALAPAVASAPRITVVYVYTNPEGTPLARADDDGNIIARYDYKPYGAPVAPVPGQLPAGPGYTGHVNDPGTGLVYMQQRYYDPVGRFLSPDPVGPTPGNVFNFNRYSYANDNPVRFTDPDGRNATAALGGLIVESINFVQGEGFNGAQVLGALKDGYNGEGAGFGGALMQDLGTASVVTGGAGIIKGLRVLATRKAAVTVAKSASKEITKASRKRVKRLVKQLSDNSRQNNGLSQRKTDQLKRIVEKAGGKLRNDGASGVKGSSAGRPHVQTEGLGKSIDSRHIWTRDGVQ